MHKTLPALAAVSICGAAAIYVHAAPRPGTAAPLREKKVLSLAAAKKMAAVVEADAMKNGVAVSIVVVDDGGKLIYWDGAMSGPMEVSEGKARTAAGFGEPRKSFKDRMAAGGLGASLATFPITAAAGGEPVIIDGQTTGAIAIGGAKESLDEDFARDAIAAITK